MMILAEISCLGISAASGPSLVSPTEYCTKLDEFRMNLDKFWTKLTQSGLSAESPVPAIVPKLL